MKRIGRIILWLVAWPLGLWRSIRHGEQKDARKEQRSALKQEHRQQTGDRAAFTKEHGLRRAMAAQFRGEGPWSNHGESSRDRS